MIVWTRLGFLVVLIGFVSFLATEFIVESLALNKTYYQDNAWPKAVGGLVGGVIIWIVGYLLNASTRKRVMIDAHTGERMLVQTGGGHTFFFVPMQYWGPVVFGAGMVVAFLRIEPLPSTSVHPGSAASNVSSQVNSAARPIDSSRAFWLELPSGGNWETVADGKVGSLDDSYTMSVADVSRSFQMSIVVMSTPENSSTLELAREGWERGFSKKMTRKKFSNPTNINGQPAHMVVGELVKGAESFEVVGILLVKNRKNFTLAFVKPGKDILNDPEVQSVLNSFKIKD